LKKRNVAGARGSSAASDYRRRSRHGQSALHDNPVRQGSNFRACVPPFRSSVLPKFGRIALRTSILWLIEAAQPPVSTQFQAKERLPGLVRGLLLRSVFDVRLRKHRLERSVPHRTASTDACILLEAILEASDWLLGAEGHLPGRGMTHEPSSRRIPISSRHVYRALTSFSSCTSTE
jgi:hypothetical protein